MEIKEWMKGKGGGAEILFYESADLNAIVKKMMIKTTYATVEIGDSTV